MNITPISVNTVHSRNMSFQANNGQPEGKKTQISASSEILKYPPAAIGVINGVCWASVGFVFDKLCSKIFRYPSENKVSLAVNSIIGLGMGIYSYVQAKKLQKSAANNTVTAQKA